MYQFPFRAAFCLGCAAFVSLPAASRDIFVEAGTTDCETRDGSEDAPFCTLQEGIDAALADGDGKVDVAPGVYLERVILREGVEIEASEEGDVIVEPPMDPSASPFAVVAAEDSKLKNMTIRIPSGFGMRTVLLYIPNVDIELENIVLDGGHHPESTGILIEGPASSHSRIRKIIFSRLEVGIEAVDTEVQITRNLFTEINRDAIYVRPPDSGTPPFLVPSLGDDELLEDSGFNRFREVGGTVPDDDKGETAPTFFIRNTAGGTMFAQLNDWDFFDSATIAAGFTTDPPPLQGARSAAPKQADAIVFEPFIGKSLFPGSIYVRVEDASSGLSIVNAAVHLFQGARDTQLEPSFDTSSKLFGFVELSPGTYEVLASAPGYSSRSIAALVGPGDIVAREIQLTSTAAALDPPVLERTVPSSPAVEPAPMLVGSATPGVTVRVFVDGVERATFVVDPTGTFEHAIETLGLGVHTIWAVASQSGLRDSATSNEFVYEVIVGGEGEGEGETANLAITPAAVAFGDVDVGDRLDGIVSIANTGPLLVRGVISVSAPFAVLGTGTFSIPSAASFQVVLRFAPERAGTYNAVATVQMTDAIQIPVSGRAVASGNPAEGDGEMPVAGCDAGATESPPPIGDLIFLVLTIGLLKMSRHRRNRVRG